MKPKLFEAGKKMVINKFCLHRSAVLALSLGIFSTTNYPIVAQEQSLNHQEITAYFTQLQPSGVEISPKRDVLAQRFKIRNVPGVGKPLRRTGAAVRGGCSYSTADKLVALLPAIEPVLTVEEYPTVFVSLPKTSAKEAEFVLLSANKDKVLYEKTITLPSNPGIVSFSLPKDGSVPPLEIGKNYYWYFSVICNPQERADDLITEGHFQRIELSSKLASDLKNASLGDRPAIYAEAGIWYDAIKTLAELRRSSPNDVKISADWTELLKSVGLENIAQKPLIP